MELNPQSHFGFILFLTWNVLRFLEEEYPASFTRFLIRLFNFATDMNMSPLEQHACGCIFHAKYTLLKQETNQQMVFRHLFLKYCRFIVTIVEKIVQI